MAKRLTDTLIWKNQRWFRKLKPLDKLAFLYIKDQCDHAGIWRIDCSDLIEELGIEEFNIQKFIVAINVEYDKLNGKKISKERVIIVKENFLWITGFIQFQYENKEGKVSPEAAPVKTAFQILQGYGILKEAIDKGYITLIQPLTIQHVRAKDKDKDKDKDIVNTNTNTRKAAKSKKIPEPAVVQFNSMPKLADFGALPEQYITSAIGLAKITSNVKLTPDTVISLWEVFKVQNLTGGNYYANEGRVYSHFLNVIKKQKFNDGTDKASGIEGTLKTLLNQNNPTKRNW